jgi:uncharacterized protein YbjT (DUF2867 family)
VKLLILGASGGTGRHLVQQALAAGHSVTAFVREAARVTVVHPALRVLVGDAMRPDSIGPIVGGHDAVLCTLGNKPEGTDRARGQPGVPVSSVGTRHLIAAMKSAGVTRLVVQSSCSVGDSGATGRFPAPQVLHLVLRSVMADKEIQEAAVRESGLAWTIFRPVRLTDGPRTDRVLVGREVRWGLGTRVSRADVAAVMLSALDDPATIGQAMTIAES